MSEKILRKPEVLERIGIKNSTLYEWIKRGAFPKQCRLGERSVGWKSSQIDEWIEQRTCPNHEGGAK